MYEPAVGWELACACGFVPGKQFPHIYFRIDGTGWPT